MASRSCVEQPNGVLELPAFRFDTADEGEDKSKYYCAAENIVERRREKSRKEKPREERREPRH